jgi:hypothetical protein
MNEAVVYQTTVSASIGRFHKDERNVESPRSTMAEQCGKTP